MRICPICKSNNYSVIIKNCYENIHLTNNSYTYKHCLDCLVISQDPLPDNNSLNKYYKYIDGYKKPPLKFTAFINVSH